MATIATIATTATTLELQHTHLDLSRTVASRSTSAHRSELRAWLAEVLDNTSKGLGDRQLALLASAQVNSHLDVSCCICLEHLSIGEFATNLPCAHKFHTSCIRRWLQQSRTCPLCMSIVDS
jgi:hypothetical protein